MKRSVTLSLVTLLSIGFLTGCSTSATNEAAESCTPAHENLETVSAGKLTAATYTLPPFIVANGTEVEGAEGAILNELAAMECLTLVGQPLDSGSVIASVLNKRVDLAAGNWYCTASRAETVGLIGPVYTDQLAIISAEGTSSYEDLVGQVVGAQDGIGSIEELKAIYGNDLRLYPTPTAMYEDLKAGRITAVVGDSFGSATYANQNNDNIWKTEVSEADPRVTASMDAAQVCLPTALDNTQLIEAFNENIEVLRENGRLAEIMESAELDPTSAVTGELRLL